MSPAPSLDQAHHQVGCAALGGIVQIGAAADADFQRKEGDLVRFHQPGVDPAGRGDLLDGNLGPQGKGRQRQGKCQQKAAHHNISLFGTTHIVTDWRRSSTMRAASRTSSGVTD